jgi:hypothetical protein
VPSITGKNEGNHFEQNEGGPITCNNVLSNYTKKIQPGLYIYKNHLNSMNIPLRKEKGSHTDYSYKDYSHS